MQTTVNNRGGSQIGAWKNHKPEWTRPGSSPDRMNHGPPWGREMKAKDHTRIMLKWWRQSGVNSADLAVRRVADGTMIWHHDIRLDVLPLPWARAENARGADVYIRPARGFSWPIVFLDDVSVDMARSIAGKYDALVVETSKEGGCHVWLRCSTFLDEDHRRRAQRWVAQRIGADLGSTSGEHLGRLAGFKNVKRRGNWVNVMVASWQEREWAAVTPRQYRHLRARPGTARLTSDPPKVDASQSAKEWGWVCERLENGLDTNETYRLLVERARGRRRGDADRYARRTVKQALVHVGRSEQLS